MPYIEKTTKEYVEPTLEMIYTKLEVIEKQNKEIIDNINHNNMLNHIRNLKF